MKGHGSVAYYTCLSRIYINQKRKGKPMKRSAKLVVAGCVAGIVALVLVAVLGGCASLLPTKDTGSITLSIKDVVGILTWLPGADMEITEYHFTGANGGESFDVTLVKPDDTIVMDNLVKGSWTCLVEGLNVGDEVVGTSGVQIVVVENNQNSDLYVTIIPISGVGTFGVTIDYPEAEVPTPSYEAEIKPYGGAYGAITMTDNGDTYTFTDPAMTNGYYVFRFVLMNEGDVVWGIAKTFRVVTGYTTTGAVTITADEIQSGGEITLYISEDMDEDITMSFDVAPEDEVLVDGNIVISVLPDDLASYEWYFNGDVVGGETAPVIDFDCTGLLEGSYRLDVVADDGGGVFASIGHSFLIVDEIIIADPLVGTWESLDTFVLPSSTIVVDQTIMTISEYDPFWPSITLRMEWVATPEFSGAYIEGTHTTGDDAFPDPVPYDGWVYVMQLLRPTQLGGTGIPVWENQGHSDWIFMMNEFMAGNSFTFWFDYTMPDGDTIIMTLNDGLRVQTFTRQ